MLTRIGISRSALLHNVQAFRGLSQHSLFMAVVKSNAYGHGIRETVGILCDVVDYFGVNSIAEAELIRTLHTDVPILLLGAIDGADLPLLRDLNDRSNRERGNVDLTVSSLDAMKCIEESCPGVRFHLKVDTGMGRLGAITADIASIASYLHSNPSLPWAGLMSHFADVEDVQNQEYAQLQLSRFAAMQKQLRGAVAGRRILYHIAASAAAMLLPQSRMDMMRVGISLYGLWPSAKTRASMESVESGKSFLRPVLNWRTRITHLKHISRGDFIGYGCSYQTSRDSLIAVLPVGYFEGYERALSNRSHVLVHGMKAALLGRVCMNMIMVDVTQIKNVRVGDEVVLIGPSGRERIEADDLANMSGTINYEIVTRIQKNLYREIIE